MKIKELLEKATEEINGENEEKGIALIKDSLKDLNECKRTLKALEKKHNELLESDVEDMEELEY